MYFLRLFHNYGYRETSIYDYLFGCLLLLMALLFLYLLKRIFSKPTSLNKLYATIEPVEILPNTFISVKASKVSLGTKVLLFGLSLFIIVMPLYEFIETLRPETYFGGHFLF